MEVLSKLFVQINRNCNLNCIYCLNEGSQKGSLDFEKYKRALEKLVNSDNEQIRLERVMITGGEPALDFDLLLKVSELHKSLNIKTMIITNAVLIDDVKAKKLRESGVDLALVSLNASNAREYDLLSKTKSNFEKVIQGIKHMLKVGIKVNIRFTLMKHNLNGAIKTYKLCEDLGTNEFEIKVVSPAGNTSDKIIPSVSEIKGVYNALFENKSRMEIKTRCFYLACPGFNVKNTIEACGCGRRWVSITCDGSIYPCLYFNERQKLGNFFEDDFLDIWKNHSILKILRKQKPEKCKNCENWEKCLNQCQGLVFRFTDSFDKTCFDVLKEKGFLKE
jgi:radical SAM protein with 4Fe4S-binding SPASM domain